MSIRAIRGASRKPIMSLRRPAPGNYTGLVGWAQAAFDTGEMRPTGAPLRPGNFVSFYVDSFTGRSAAGAD